MGQEVDVTTTVIEAGLELDALVAERVMGWSRITKYDRDDFWVMSDGYHKRVRSQEDWEGDYYVGPEAGYHPSKNIEEAWEVVEHLRHVGTLIAVSQWLPGRYCAYLTYAPQYIPQNDSMRFVAESAPLAICLAALKAVENDPR